MRSTPFVRGQRGSILIAVIAMISMLVIFAAAVSRQVSQELVFGRWLNSRTRALALAKSGVQRALQEIKSDKVRAYDALNEAWASNQSVFGGLEIGEGQFVVVCDESLGPGMTPDKFHFGACDEAARLNINKASESQLKGLLKAVDSDLSNAQITSIAEGIIDWRDGDDAELPSGAEANRYKSQAHPYTPRNGEFESTEELLLIRGMTPEIYQKMRPFITVYTDGRVNFNTAPAKVLQGMGLSSELAWKIIGYRRGIDGIDGTRDDQPFSYVDGITSEISAAGTFTPEEYEQISNLIAQGSVGVASDVFRIYSRGRLNKDSAADELLVTCVLKRSGDILYWKEGY